MKVTIEGAENAIGILLKVNRLFMKRKGLKVVEDDKPKAKRGPKPKKAELED